MLILQYTILRVGLKTSLNIIYSKHKTGKHPVAMGVAMHKLMEFAKFYGFLGILSNKLI
jgi:hypothetical protein